MAKSNPAAPSQPEQAQSDLERKAQAFDALVATLETVGPGGEWADRPMEAREGAFLVLVAMLDALRAGGSGTNTKAVEPLMQFLAGVAGLQHGHRSWLYVSPRARWPRAPVTDLARLADIAVACATVDLLHKGGREIGKAVADVAVAARAILPGPHPRQFLANWRKELNANRKPAVARWFYDHILSKVAQGYADAVAEMSSRGESTPPDFARKYHLERGLMFVGELRQKRLRK